jgi:O-antigen/teichoic acid export membrane protein
MSGRSGLALLNNAAAAAVNVTACLLLVPRLGAVGAAVAAASALVLLQAVQVVEVAFLCGALPFSTGFFKALASGLTAAAAVEYLLPARGDSLWRAFESGAAALVAYGALVLMLGLAAEEWTVVHQVVGWGRRGAPPHVESVS